MANDIPPTTLSFGVDGASIVLRIRNKNYTLTAPKLRVSTAGSKPARPAPVHLEFKESFDDAIDLGTLAEFLGELETLLGPIVTKGASSSPTVTHYIDQWGIVKGQLRGAPVLGEAVETLLTTNVRIIEIGLDLTNLSEDPSGTPPTKYKGTFTFGLMCVPAEEHRPRLFNIEVMSFGTVLTVVVEGQLDSKKRS